MDVTKIKIIFFVALFGIFLIADYYMESWKQETFETAEIIHTKGFLMDEEKAKSELLAYENAVNQAKSLLKEYNYSQAAKIYSAAEPAASIWSNSYGQETLINNQTIDDFYQKQKHKMEDLLDDAIKKSIKRMENGKETYESKRILTNHFSGISGQLLAKRYDEAMDSIKEIRTQLAGNWIRVDIKSMDQYDVSTLYNAFDQKWDKYSLRKHVNGPAFSPDEKNATLKTIEVELIEDSIAFTATTTSGIQQQYKVPFQLTARFSSTNGSTASPHIMTNWDQLPDKIVEAPLPNNYRFETGEAGVNFDKEADKRRKMLINKMVAEFHSLPVFGETAASSP